MPLNPLAPVTDYQSMLNRIFWFTTASALAAVWLLRTSIPALDAALVQLDFPAPLGGGKALPTPGGYLLPALGVGIASRVFRLHARLSDWMGLREHFDTQVIIRGFAEKLRIDLEHVEEEELRTARHRVMRKAFYPYVSGSSPAIDAQLVQQALDAWSWFWIGVEAAAVFTVASWGLIACRVHAEGFQTLAAAMAFAAVGLPALRGQCKRYAIAQVRAIVADPSRERAVRSAFEEFATGESEQRLAA